MVQDGVDGERSDGGPTPAGPPAHLPFALSQRSESSDMQPPPPDAASSDGGGASRASSGGSAAQHAASGGDDMNGRLPRPLQPLPPTPRYDKLTVFQAAPLVWKDQDDELHTVEMLDFDREREILTESMREARTVGNEVELVFETANTERLGAFLATSETQVLHFTCHGMPEYLAIEDGTGGAQFLRVDDLRDFMSAGNGKLLFVFVSACYSKNAGEAFLEAGVPHVVCCQHDEPLMDLAAQEFSRSFYLALACGRNLRQSFELGKQAVKLCPQIPDATNEMGKFLLLPEDGDHDVPIFFTRPRAKSFGVKPSSSSWILPPPPEIFVGREMEMYRVLQNLQRSRLVRITGFSGSGKAGLAAAVARYISVRERTCSLFDQVVWLPLIHTARSDKLSSSFAELFAILQDEGLAFSLRHNVGYSRACGTIIDAFHQTKVLLVIETKGFLEMQSVSKLSIFLQDLFRGTTHVRVLLVVQAGVDISLRNSVVESEVAVEPLDFEQTATLFGRLCTFVSDHRYHRACTPRQLSNILVPKNKGDVRLLTQRSALSKRCVDIFRAIGEGVPAQIHALARSMKPKEYDRLIELGEQIEYNSDCKSRVELEVQLDELGEDLQVAVREQNFQKARDIQGALDELERQREALPELEELRRMASDLKGDLENAVLQRNFVDAENLNQQLNLLNKKVDKEQEALLKYDRDKKPSGEAGERKDGAGEGEGEEGGRDKFSTRARLESEVLKLQNDLDEAVKKRDFPACQRIQEMIDEYCARRESLPSVEELSTKITALNVDLESAISAREFGKAESIHRQIQSLEGKVVQEKESEDDYVAATAMLMGRQLSNLGESLQEAVNAHDLSKAKEIESNLLREIKGIEERFVLRYTAAANEQGAGQGQAGRDDGGGSGGSNREEEENQRRISPPARGAVFDRDARIRMKNASSPPPPPASASASSSRPGRQSRNEAEDKNSSTVAAMPSRNDQLSVSEATPGAVAVPGLGLGHAPAEGRQQGSSFAASLHPPPPLPRSREQAQSHHRYHGDDASEKSSSHSSTSSESGSIARRLQRRFEKGMCPTCTGPSSPTQCYVFKSSRGDPQIKTRIPLTVDGLVYQGKCLICNPGEGQRPAVRPPPPPPPPMTAPVLETTWSGHGTTPEPAALTAMVSRVSSSVPRAPSASENGAAAVPSDIAVATTVDAVAQEEAIERIVRDTIRRVADGDNEPTHRATDAQVQAVVDNGQRKKNKSSIIKTVLKFGKRKKGS